MVAAEWGLDSRMGAPKKDNRLTKLQDRRKEWDYIIAAFYHYGQGVYGPQMGYRTVGKMFALPPSTVRGIVDRAPKNDPEVRHAALRFNMIKFNMDGINTSMTDRQRDIGNLLVDLN